MDIFAIILELVQSFTTTFVTTKTFFSQIRGQYHSKQQLIIMDGDSIGCGEIPPNNCDEEMVQVSSPMSG
jgi:hypothetical protein